MDRRYYLDHAATSWPKPPEVGEQLQRSLTELTTNAGRSSYTEALASARILFSAREALARLFGVSQSENIVFTRGCTEGLNLVLKGLLKTGDRVAVSPMEHNAVMRPLRRLIIERDVVAETLPADLYGRIDLGLCEKIAEERKFSLLIVSHSSNVNGVVQDLSALRAIFAETPILVDAAQTAGVLPIDVEELDIDFLCCSAHKGLLGPSGLGVTYISPLYEFPPLIEGGTGSNSQSYEQPLYRPDRYESGTPNFHGIAALFGALSGIEQRGLLGKDKLRHTQVLVEELNRIHGVRLNSPPNCGVLCVSLTIAGASPDEVAFKLEREYGVLCRSGLHCAPAAHHHLGTLPEGTIRFSPGWGTTEEHLDRAVSAVHNISKSLKQ